MVHDLTDEQIMALSREAFEAGDYRTVNICNLALALREPPYFVLDAMGKTVMLDRPGARAECARIIAAARAQDDSEVL